MPYWYFPCGVDIQFFSSLLLSFSIICFLPSMYLSFTGAPAGGVILGQCEPYRAEGLLWWRQTGGRDYDVSTEMLCLEFTDLHSTTNAWRHFLACTVPILFISPLSARTTYSLLYPSPTLPPPSLLCSGRYAYHGQSSVEVRVARIFNTFGPRMHPNDGRVVSNFIIQVCTSVFLAESAMD